MSSIIGVVGKGSTPPAEIPQLVSFTCRILVEEEGVLLRRLDVRHDRPQLHVVDAELLGGGVRDVVVRAAVSEPDQVAELVHQCEIGIAALGLRKSLERSGVVADGDEGAGSGGLSTLLPMVEGWNWGITGMCRDSGPAGLADDRERSRRRPHSPQV